MLFRKKGFQATTLDEIGESADVSVGSVFVHFSSKAGLYLALVERALDLNEAAMTQVAAAIELFVRWCGTQPWSESYICQHFIGVRSFYKTCVRDDVLLRNPAEFVAAPAVHEEGQKRTFLTPLKFAAFLKASRQAGPIEHAAAALMGLSGLRVAEMCSLRVESLSQDGGYDGLEFIGKGGKPADIPLPVPVMRAVRVLVDGRTTGPLLRNRAGKALTTLDARRMVNRIAKAAGCRHITPHGLRRTFCTAGLVSGVPMRDMQIAMRHADPRTTGLYDMAKNNKDRHASRRVASFLAGMTG